jgi:DNA-directed RNA polymerase specialized sigma24 family protein
MLAAASLPLPTLGVSLWAPWADLGSTAVAWAAGCGKRLAGIWVDGAEVRARLVAAVAGERAAQAWMVARLNPTLQKAAAGLLWSVRPMLQGRPSRQEVVDLVHDGWDILLADRGRVLLGWDPELGALEPYVGAVVRKRLISKLRTLKHNPFTDRPLEPEIIQRVVGMGDGLCARVEDADLVSKVLVLVWERLTPLGREVLQVFMMDGASVEDVMAQTGLSKESVRSWRKRIRNTAKEVMDGLKGPEGEPS